MKAEQQHPLTPILQWLIDEQGGTGITGKELANISGIAPQTWSRVRQGHQDLTTESLWKIIEAIAQLRPQSECAQVISIIQGKKKRLKQLTLPEMIEVSSEKELEEAMILIVKKLFPRKNNDESMDVSSSKNDRKSPIPLG
jgi:transcriptional regulator with XRE-family HTH domain